MNNDLKNKIKSAYESETPDNKGSIIAACKNEAQFSSAPVQPERIDRKRAWGYRLAVAAACLAVFCAGLLAGGFATKYQPTASAETCVYLDVNPSLEISLDEDNTVLSCKAANADAEIILSGMRLENVEFKTALNAIVGAMYVNGYLSREDNSMLVSVDTNDVSNTGGYLSYITNQVNEVFKNSGMECAIIAQGVRADDDLKRRARENGISVGKMFLVDKMVDSMDDLTERDISELSGMSIKDLNLIYSQKPVGGQTPENELISGTVGGYLNTDDALTAVLTEIGKTADDVEECNIHTLPSKNGNARVVYAVTLKLYGDGVYKFEVDCKTGEVEVAHDGMPDEPPQDGGFENGEPPAGNGNMPLPPSGVGEERP